MKLIPIQSERILALLLISALAACDPSAEQAAEPASAPAMESTEAASGSSDEGTMMPEPDRFANMYVSEVSDAFNPGVQIGAQFPAIKALYQGEEITGIDRFIRDRGAIFIAARSVDW
jgi:hypothetical protein